MSRLPPPPPLSVKFPGMDNSSASELTPSRLSFPTEFPYEFDSLDFSPGFTSPGESTETEDESSDDEEDFLAGLTRRLVPSTQRLTPPLIKNNIEEKRQLAATSPQSTPSGLESFSNSEIKSPNFPISPAPTTSFPKDNTWDVISAAAGEVAKLKLGSYESQFPRRNPNPNPLLHRQNAAFQSNHRIQNQRLLDLMWIHTQSRLNSSENLRYIRHNVPSNNPSWSPKQIGTQGPLKRPCAGTGVFLPRQYPKTHCDSRQGSFRPRGGGGCLNQERRLPQDWMY